MAPRKNDTQIREAFHIFEKKDLYAENYKTLMKAIKMIQTDGEIHHVLGLEDSTL